MVILHGDVNDEVSISVSFLEVVGLYAHYDSQYFFLRFGDAFFCDVANNTGDFLILSIVCFLDQDDHVGEIRHCDALIPFLVDF